MLCEGEVVGVDEVEGWVAVHALAHDIADIIQGHKNWGSAWSGDLGPEGLEDGPRDVVVAGAELAESGEGHFGRGWDGEVVGLGDGDGI